VFILAGLGLLKNGSGDPASAKQPKGSAPSRARQRIRLGLEALERRDLMSVTQPIALYNNWTPLSADVQAVCTAF
jgi:hypothetical protein